MNQVYSAFLGATADGSDEVPFEDLPAFTGTEWWRDGEAAPPPNAQFVDGAVIPNAPYGTSFAADAPYAYNPAKSAPYGTSYGSEMADQLATAIDSDPYAIGQNLGLMGVGDMGNYMDDSVSSWDDGTTNISW